MAVPSSGELSMLKMAKEKKYDDYNSGSSINPPISLFDLFLGGNANGSGENYEATNTNGVNYPYPTTLTEFNQNSELSIGEWYGYDHDFGLTCSTLFAFTSVKGINAQTCNTTRTLTRYRNNSVWLNATQLYENIGGGSCQPAPADYYYDPNAPQGTPVRYWNGAAFTGNFGCL